MKKYYHFTDILDLDLDVIKAKTIQFFNTTKERLDAEFLVFNWHNFNKAVPELTVALEKQGYTIVQYSAFVMRTATHCPPHRDDTIHPIRLNIPICNTAETWTCFYEPVDPTKKLPKSNPLNNGLYSYLYPTTDIVQMDKMQLSQPAWIRPLEIHGVTCEPGARMPRLALTLSLDPFPYELFPDIPQSDRVSWQDIQEDTKVHESRYRQTINPKYIN